MYLSSVEIFGFKSFAQRTHIKFNEGITAIVGPNGCGKTNIVDAIRWCLGEQRSGTLRSDKMENVIFNGTATKKPMGMAEVSLSIQNISGKLPTEFSDITITRRIFRSGESEYLLNKNICRLKDITNLFMDTGIGANAYSVIELKMVETILSNKADERRIMFEEAAGVNKYKHRRRLALKKLEEVNSDLTRVNDIVSEVSRKVNSLERQARKADKYNEISTTLREIELDFTARELAYFSQQMSDLKAGKEINIEIKIESDSEIVNISDQLHGLKQSLVDLEKTLNEKRQEISVRTEKIYNLQNIISVAEERNNLIKNNVEKYKQELEDSITHLDHTVEVLNECKEKLDNVTIEIENNNIKTNEITSKLEELKIQLEEKRRYLKSKSDGMNEKLKEITNKENELDNKQKTLEERSSRIIKLNEKILNLTNIVAKSVGYIEELNAEKETAIGNLNEAEEYYIQQQDEKEKLVSQLDELKAEELKLKGMINGIKDKIIFLRNLVENLEGFSKGTKTLMENSDWSTNDTALLANVGQSTSKFRSAFDAALKNNLNSILIESLNDLKSGIEYLRNNEIGKASFYLLRNNSSAKIGLISKLHAWKRKRITKKLLTENGVLGFASEYVEADSKWQPYFNKLLNNVTIVDNIDTALQLSEKYYDFKFATLDGDYLDNIGVVEGGSASRIDESIFGRKQLLDDLVKEIPLKEAELTELKRNIEEVEIKIRNVDLKELSSKSRMLVNDLATIEKQIAQFEFEKKKAYDEIENTHQEIKDIASEANEVDNQRIIISEEHEILLIEKQTADSELTELENIFKEFEQNYNSQVEHFNNEKLQLERLHGEKRNLHNNIEQADKSIERIKNTIEKRNTDIKTSNGEIFYINRDIEQNKLELTDYVKVKETIQTEESEIKEKHNSLRLQIDELELEQSKIRNKRDLITEELHESEMKLSELRLKSDNIVEHIQETYSLTLEHKQFDDLDNYNFEERSNEIHELKEKVKNLGPINLLAYSEYEEVKQRLDFLSGQRDDLLQSEKDIFNTIEEINNTAQEKFLDTFEKIRGHFINIFRGLFSPGDEADLRLENSSDPLEGIIEIIAKPKGKRPTSIDLLSGGEKTLTAIALLFAIYLVKPSPFCILDEIDAPLDDANIDRFSKIINDFSANTQFIIVTHNKRTMEAARTMYGVTMQEEGISKLVSVMFNEDFDFAPQV